MTLPIVAYGDPVLKKKAENISPDYPGLKKLIEDMFETMYDAGGIGLAATQVDAHLQILVMDTSEEKNDPLCFINPEILTQEGEFEYKEGCLSVPNFYEKVTRPGQITVKALNREGIEFEMQAHDLLATCIQHEMDHLDGKLFIDHLSALKRQRIKAKLEKIHRLEGK